MGKDTNNLFLIQTANERLEYARQLPEELNLFDVLWTDNEVCILFAKPGVGKSILAMQAAEVIASGKNIGGFGIKATPKRIGFLDFELGHKQFEKRYSNYTFSENLIVITPNEDANVNFANFQQFEKERLNQIKQITIDYKLDAIIIDNLTWINSESEKGNVSGKFMQEIKSFQKKNSISVMVIAHTPKVANNQPIQITDLYGSSMLSNYADSIFSIGESEQGADVRYIKQIKTRSAERQYHMHEVLTIHIKSYEGLLCFEQIDQVHEWSHLKRPKEQAMNGNIKAAQKMKAEGYSVDKITDELGVSKRTVYNYLRDDEILF